MSKIKKMFVDRTDNYKIDNLRIMTKERCKYNLEMKTCHLVSGTGKMQRRNVKFYKSKRINVCQV